MSDPLADAFARHAEDARIANMFATSPAMKVARSKALAVTYRCARGCVLAYVYVTAPGVIVSCPPYKLSPNMNAETSNESGRALNTSDGERRWKGRAFMLDPRLDYDVTCDHLHRTVRGADLSDAATRREGRVTLSLVPDVI